MPFPHSLVECTITTPVVARLSTLAQELAENEAGWLP
jgi:hypothetical protein